MLCASPEWRPSGRIPRRQTHRTSLTC